MKTATPAEAKQQLDAHVREIIQWHLNPETGCPFWLDFASKLGFDPRREIQSFEDLRKLPPFEDDWLRGGPVRRWVPRGLADKPAYVFETGGTTGIPKSRVAIERPHQSPGPARDRPHLGVCLSRQGTRPARHRREAPGGDRAARQRAPGGNRIRVTAQLIRIADESHLWSDRYDCELTDVFAIQDEISQAIAGALQVKLAGPGRRVEDLRAYQADLKGRYHLVRYTPASLAKAKECFEQALEHDPTYAPAYVGLAAYYYILGALSMKATAEVAPLAKSAAEKALALDSSQAEAHSILGMVTGAVEYDWPAGERHFQIALAVEPVAPYVRFRDALYYLIPQGRFEVAFQQFQRALETDPLFMTLHFALAYSHYLAGQLDQAIDAAVRALDIDPNFWLIHFILGMAHLQKGALAQSIASLERCNWRRPIPLGRASWPPPISGRGVRNARRACSGNLRTRTEACISRPFPALPITSPWAKGCGLRLPEVTFAHRETFLTRTLTDPLFASIRSNPRYLTLLRRMNLA